MNKTYKIVVPITALVLMSTLATAQTTETAPVNDDPAGQGSINVDGDPTSNIFPDTETASGKATSGGLTTEATAKIAGPVSAEDFAEGTVVMALTGEIVGKVVSMVDSDDGTQLVVQVEGPDGQNPEQNVVLPMSDFMKVDDGNFTVDATMEQFMVLVEEQNPT